MKAFIDFTLNDSDKKLLIVLLCVLVLLFVIVALIGFLIRTITIKFQGRMDYEIHEAVVYRVISSPEQLRKYGREKNHRLLVKSLIGPIILLAISLLLYLVYSAIYNIWARDYFGEFSTLLFTWDWQDPSCYSYFWGMTLLSRWPNVLNTPTWVGAYWGSYLLVPLWIVAIVWYSVCIHAYIARELQLSKRCKTVFEKSLDDFNYFDDGKMADGPLPPKKSEDKASGRFH